MNKKIGYAVLGLGIGKAHADAAAASENAELVAICDIDTKRLDEVAEKYPYVKKYTSFDELLTDDTVDIISICLPSAMHAEYAVRAMEAGKNVLIEKPIDITPEAAMKIEEARRRLSEISNIKVGVVHQNRNNHCMRPLKTAIDDGRLGKIFLGTFAVKWYRTQAYYEGWHGTWDMDGGGSLMNQAVHTVDLMQWLMGEVTEVSSQTGIYAHDIETEDLSASVLRFKSGAVATFVSTTCAYPGISTEICIYGSEGSAELDADTLKTWKMKSFSPEFADKLSLDAFDVEDEEEELLEKYASNAAFERNEPNAICGHRSVVEDMILAVRDDRDPQITPLEAVKSVKIVNAIYESARTGKPVKLS